MNIEKRLNKIENVIEVNQKEETGTPNIFIKNLTDLVDKESFIPFRYDRMIQEIIRKAKV